MDLIADTYISTHQEWVFILFLLFLSYVAFLKYNYFSRFVLILMSPFSQKHANQFLREESRSSNKLYLLPLFAAFVSLYVLNQSFSIDTFLYYFASNHVRHDGCSLVRHRYCCSRTASHESACNIYCIHSQPCDSTN